MKKSASTKKLSLNRETLKRLGGEELREAGGVRTFTCPAFSWCFSCPVTINAQC